MVRWRPLPALVALALVLSGCSLFKAKEPPPPAPVPEPVAPSVRAEALLPAGDIHVTYGVVDVGKPEVKAEEEWIREGGRLVMLQGGVPYAVWELRPDGLWRPDPRNRGVLLRYLPAEAKSGDTWKHESAGRIVWFTVSQATGECLQQAGDCWKVQVLNSGELTAFWFAAGAGPVRAEATNYVKPADGFAKTMKSQGKATLLADARRSTLAKVGTATEVPAMAATAEQFAQAVKEASQGKPVTMNLPMNVDLDLDGQPEVIRTGTNEFVEVVGAGGALLGSIAPGSVEVRSIPGVKQPLLVAQRKGDYWEGGFALFYVGGDRATPTPVPRLYGLPLGEIKTGWTPSDRASIAPDGLITVEWDMGDPARHTRVKRFRLTEDNIGPKMTDEQITFVPQEKELRYPSTPKEVLLAAAITCWYGLDQERPRYFATPAAAAALCSTPWGEPDYGPGTVAMGVLETAKPGSEPGLRAAPLGSDGSTDFMASWGGYEWCASVWGQVTFGKDGQGRPVITAAHVVDRFFAGH